MVPVPVPVPTFEKVTVPVPVTVPGPYLDSKFLKKNFGIFFDFLLGKLFHKEKVHKISTNLWLNVNEKNV